MAEEKCRVQWIPVRTASKLLRVSTARVYQLIDRGALSSRTIDGTVLVSYESVSRRATAQCLLPGTVG